VRSSSTGSGRFFNKTFIGLLAPDTLTSASSWQSFWASKGPRSGPWQKQALGERRALQCRCSANGRFWGVVLTLGLVGLGIVLAIALPVFMGRDADPNNVSAPADRACSVLPVPVVGVRQRILLFGDVRPTFSARFAISVRETRPGPSAVRLPKKIALTGHSGSHNAQSMHSSG